MYSVFSQNDRWTLLYHAQGAEPLTIGDVLCVFTEWSDRWTLLYHAQGVEPRRRCWWLVAADVLDRWGFLFLSISLSWVLCSPLCYDFCFPSSCLGKINRPPFYSLMGWVKPNLLVGQDKLPRLAESLREVAQHWWVVLQWVIFQEMKKQMSSPDFEPKEDGKTTVSLSKKRRPSSAQSWGNALTGRTSTSLSGDSRLWSWDYAWATIDSVSTCSGKWSWHHHQSATAVLKTTRLNVYCRDARFCRQQEQM